MPKVLDFIPSRKEEERLNSYAVIRNYVECIAGFVPAQDERAESMLESVADSRVFKRIQAGKCNDIPAVGRLLRHCWLTEIQLVAAAATGDLLQYTNHWAPTFLYYAVYLSGRAMLLARGSEVRDAHKKTLKVIGNEIAVRPDLFPQPWKTCCCTCDQGKDTVLRNQPPRCKIGDLNPLSSVTQDSFWSRYAMLLRTTHKGKIEERITEWKRTSGKQRATRAIRGELSKQVPPTTLFDFLYRLRIRSNYLEADSSLAALRFRQESGELNQQLRKICWNTLLVLEFLTARHLGLAAYQRMLEEFSRYDCLGISSDLAKSLFSVITSASRSI